MSTVVTRAPAATLGGRTTLRRESGRVYRWPVFALGLTDVVSLFVALLLAQVVTQGWGGLGTEFLPVLVTAIPVWLLVFLSFGLYSTNRLSPSEEFVRTLSAASLGTVLILMASFWWPTTPSRTWICGVWGLAVLLESTLRRAWRWRVGRLRLRGSLSLRTLVVGADAEAGRLADALKFPGHGFSLVGYVSGSSQRPLDGLPWVGQIDRLEALIHEHEVECLFVAATALGADEMMPVVQAARRAGVEVRLSANLPELLASRWSVQPVGPVTALSLRPVRLTGAQATMKRILDAVVATVGLAASLPVLALVAAVVRLTSPGPVLFRQRRVTVDGCVFTMYKFRTMVQDAENGLGAGYPDPKSNAFFKLHNDPRVTRVGRVLRKFSLDELPQLVNVMKGDMSLVGPRALREEQVTANQTLLGPRHEIRSGITGWWQINGRNDLPPEEAVRMDLFYIDNWSLALDLYILLKTAGAVLARRGAY